MLHYLGKKVFADVIKLKMLRWGHNPGLYGCAQMLLYHKCPYKREVQWYTILCGKRREYDVKREAENGMVQPQAQECQLLPEARSEE